MIHVCGDFLEKPTINDIYGDVYDDFYGNDPPGIKHGNYSIGNPRTFQGGDLARETT